MGNLKENGNTEGSVEQAAIWCSTWAHNGMCSAQIEVKADSP